MTHCAHSKLDQELQMAEFRVLHCADLHLGSPFIGLSRVDAEAARLLREATFSSFRRIVDYAIERRVHLVTVAGDVYDSADHGLSTAVRFREELRRLSDTGIPCCIVAGNHDPLADRRLLADLPRGCHLFGEQAGRLPIERGGDVMAHVYGVSFKTRAVKKNLAKQLIAAYHDAPGLHIALLHCNVGGCMGHEDYAPCTLGELREASFDAWLLGHVHERQTMSDVKPLVVYPGNSQGRSVRELGNRGACLIRFRDDGSTDIEFIPTADVFWHCGETSIEGLTDLEELVERLDEDLTSLVEANSEQRAVVVRWNLVGRGGLHQELTDGLEELRETLREMRQRRTVPVLIERLVNSTRPTLDFDELRQQPGFVSMVLACGEEFAAESAPENQTPELFNALLQGPGLKGPLGDLRNRVEQDPEFRDQIIEFATLYAVDSLLDEGGK